MATSSHAPAEPPPLPKPPPFALPPTGFDTANATITVSVTAETRGETLVEMTPARLAGSTCDFAKDEDREEDAVFFGGQRLINLPSRL